ncbi:amino acid adenylation domain-containing protein [Nonomuraea sp. B10E15]|uniref:amino acid adenylation domain-containing protein n=1 Tax=Nonomuraea sp. B10E15 TaxID=3153560 RepID=UPI00325D6085
MSIRPKDLPASARRKLLADRVRAAQAAPSSVIPRHDGQEPAPTSFAQERLWLIDQLQGQDHTYNVYHAFRVAGPLDRAALRRALDGLLERHEALRTTFAPGEPAAVQVVGSGTTMPLTERDLSGLSPDELERRVLAECRTPFDLTSGPLCRAALFRRGAEEHVLVLVLHHIVTDGWSTEILAEDLAAGYAGRSRPEPGTRYRDFSVWQRERLSGDRLRAELNHWRSALAGQPHVLELPTDRPRAATFRHDGAETRVTVPPDLTARLRELADRCGASLYMLLLTAVRTLLRAHSGQDRFILATSIAGRDRPELEEVVGCFVNTLALGGDLSGDPSFAGALSRERATVLDAFAHQDLPFERLVRELVTERDTARNPLAQVFVQLGRGTGEGWRLPGLRVEELAVANDVAKFDLSFFFRDRGDDLVLTLEYATALFDAATADRLASRAVRLLESAADAPDLPLSSLRLLPDDELRELEGWNDTVRAYQRVPLPEMVSRQAAGHGDRQAVQYGDARLTYAELEQAANRLAHHLRRAGVGRGDLVAVFLERGLDLPVTLLAVQRAGAAYVPLNPGEPADRVALILQDAAPAMILTQRELLPQLPGGAAEIHVAAEHAAAIASMPDTPPELDRHPHDLAYVIFTSGSTGRPKGVAVPHGALSNFLATMAERPGITGDDVLLAVTTPSFDIAALELFLPLVTGGKVVIADRYTALDGDRLRALITSSGATIMQATPATWRLLGDCPELEGLTVLVGGEALTPDVAGPLTAAARGVWNMYGPTETTIWSTVRPIAGRDLTRGAAALPIGTPIANTRCLVLDADLRQVPTGVPGELYIAGDGVARGYHGRPGLSADRFVPDPYGPPGTRLYRTGDLVRRLPDGDLEFLGRNDHQVKVRGFRIETSEIDARLAEHPDVAQAVVVAHEFAPGDRRLVAYLTAAGREPDPADLRAHLARKLPDYMVPTVYMTLPDFPLTPNRKVDRKALPSPAVSAAPEADQAPRSGLEKLVAEVWSDVLGVAVPGVHADFFTLGGHSLLAVQAMNRVNAELGTAVEVRALFDAPTVAGLAARLATEDGLAGDHIAVVPRDRPPRASFGQERMWFLDQMFPGVPDYHLPVELSLRGPLEVEALRAALTAVLGRHESLRTRLRLSEQGVLVQEIAPPGEVALPVDDVTAAADPAAAAEEIVAAAAAAPFDLGQDPLLRARLVRLAADDHLLLITMHHAGADGASIDLLRQELAGRYAEAAHGAPADLPELKVQYADVAAWQRDHFTGEDEHLAFWRAELAGLPPLELPVDRERPAVRRPAGACHAFTLPEALATQVDSFARANATTPFVVLLAAFQAALARLSGQGDLAVTTPVSNRDNVEIQHLVGMFVNTLVIRADLSRDPTFAEVVRQAKRRVTAALAHRALPFERVVSELVTDRDPARPPLSPVHFTLDTAPAQEWTLPGLDVRRLPERILTARYELAMGLTRTADGLAGVIEYSPILLDEDTVASFANGFRELLATALSSPYAPLGGIARDGGDDSATAAPGEPARPSRPPEGPAEEIIADVWHELLGRPVRDAFDDFFQLGGHSLLVARLRMRLQDNFGVDLPMHGFFAATSIAEQAAEVQRAIEDELAGLSDHELLASLEREVSS